MYKLSDIFNADNIKQKRKILSNFPITREDRNKTLVGSMNSSGGSSNSEGGFIYKSRKVCWKVIDQHKFRSEESVNVMKTYLSVLPIYSAISRSVESVTYYYKDYGFKALSSVYYAFEASIYGGIDSFEESQGYGNLQSDTNIFLDTNKGLLEMVKVAFQMSDDAALSYLKDNVGIEQIPYNEYLSVKLKSDNKYANF